MPHERGFVLSLRGARRATRQSVPLAAAAVCATTHLWEDRQITFAIGKTENPQVFRLAARPDEVLLAGREQLVEARIHDISTTARGAVDGAATYDR